MNDTATFMQASQLHQTGHFVEARALYEQVLIENPRHFETLLHLAILAYQNGDAADAVRRVDLALAVNPDFPPALNSRGTFLLALGKSAEALVSIDRSIALNPSEPVAHTNRGVALEALGRPQEALVCFDVAIALNPNSAKAHCDRASVLLDLRRFDEAIASCDRAIALQPDHARALSNRGVILFERGNKEAALVSFDAALAAQPEYAVAHRNRGGVLDALKRYSEALASHRLALTYDPTLPLVAGSCLYIKMATCDWQGLGAEIDWTLRDIDADKLPCAPFIALMLPSSLPQQRRIATAYCAHRTHGITAAPLSRKRRSGKIRIGYFSADLNNHAVGHAIAGVFENHDRARFEITGFQLSHRPDDSVRQRIQGAMDKFVDVSEMSDGETAELARTLDIDIAVDLMGFTTDSRPGIFVHRAAPVQVGYLGYAGTTGAPVNDYMIADPIVIPPQDRTYYSEAIAYLLHSFMATDSRRPIATHTITRAEAGLPETGVVFCGFNAATKITPEVFDVWMRLLTRVAGSVLWLSVQHPDARQNLLREAQARGIGPERLVFNTYMPMADHLARHRLADVFLDTFDYGAHSTGVDALWAGLPVVTRMGETFASRVGASLLTAVGLPELIAADTLAYERIAFEIATDVARRIDLKNHLRENIGRFPLFDTAGLTRNIESAFTTMWQRYQAGAPPADFQA